MINNLRLKSTWKFWEFAYSVSWYVLGDTTFTWKAKDTRDSALLRYNLNKQVN